MIVGVDSGRAYVKVRTSRVLDRFPSLIKPYFETNLSVLEEAEGFNKDMIVSYEVNPGEVVEFYVGNVVQFVKDGGSGSNMSPEKGTLENIIMILTGLYLAGANEIDPVFLVTNSPLDRFKKDQESLKRLLEKRHRIKVTTSDGVDHRVIHIAECKVGVEGLGGYYNEYMQNDLDEAGYVRVIDLGSRTVNCLSFLSGRYDEGNSFPLPWGWNTLRKENQDPRRVAADLAGTLKSKWGEDDRILFMGGKASDLSTAMKAHFPNLVVVENPQYANVNGFYLLGQSEFGE